MKQARLFSPKKKILRGVSHCQQWKVFVSTQIQENAKKNSQFSM